MRFLLILFLSACGAESTPGALGEPCGEDWNLIALCDADGVHTRVCLDGIKQRVTCDCTFFEKVCVLENGDERQDS